MSKINCTRSRMPKVLAKLPADRRKVAAAFWKQGNYSARRAAQLAKDIFWETFLLTTGAKRYEPEIEEFARLLGLELRKALAADARVAA